jgi:hypothetical protein
VGCTRVFVSIDYAMAPFACLSCSFLPNARAGLRASQGRPEPAAMPAPAWAARALRSGMGPLISARRVARRVRTS